MHRRNFFLSSAASLLGSTVGLARERGARFLRLRQELRRAPSLSGAGSNVPAESEAFFSEAVPVPGSWQPLAPAPRVDFGFDPLHFETTFWELRPGRLAPINTKTAVGLPGWPVIGFGYLMRARYSEFQLRFTMAGRQKERLPHTLPNFRQRSPRDWLPGAVSEWDDGGLRYRVTYIVVPNEPQPLDLYQIVLKNTSRARAKGKLLVTLDGATTMMAAGDLIADRGKPLVVMDPVVPVERLGRDAPATPRAAKTRRL